MNFKLLSIEEREDFVLENAGDADQMLAYANFLDSERASVKDAGLASSINSEVQNAQSDESTEVELSQGVEVTDPAPIVELTLSEEKTNPSVKNAVTRKAKTFKPREVLAVERKFHTIQEVAACYRIGVSTLHKYLKDGLIEGFKMGNQWRFSQGQIDAFENRISSGGK